MKPFHCELGYILVQEAGKSLRFNDEIDGEHTQFG